MPYWVRVACACATSDPQGQPPYICYSPGKGGPDRGVVASSPARTHPHLLCAEPVVPVLQETGMKQVPTGPVLPCPCHRRRKGSKGGLGAQEEQTPCPVLGAGSVGTTVAQAWRATHHSMAVVSLRCTFCLVSPLFKKKKFHYRIQRMY